MDNSGRRDNWSDDELNILKKYYATETYDFLVSKGLERTEMAVKTRAKLLGLKRKKMSSTAWSEEDVILLVSEYKEGGLNRALNCGLNKKESSIRSKIRSLGLVGSENMGVLWNKERLDILNTYYATEGVEGVRRRGVRESKDVVLSKAIELGMGVKFG